MILCKSSIGMDCGPARQNLRIKNHNLKSPSAFESLWSTVLRAGFDRTNSADGTTNFIHRDFRTAAFKLSSYRPMFDCCHRIWGDKPSNTRCTWIFIQRCCHLNTFFTAGLRKSLIFRILDQFHHYGKLLPKIRINDSPCAVSIPCAV